MGGEEVGRRLLTVKLMGPEISQDYCSASTSDIIRNCQFIPYSFKELNQVDIVEFSALQSLKMVKYMTGLQRHCLPTDVFFWTIFNTDAEGDRLVIKGANGNANVIGWPEIAVAFGAHHDPQEQFRSNKVMQSKLRDLQPELFLPQAVESNPNKKLVNGQRIRAMAPVEPLDQGWRHDPVGLGSKFPDSIGVLAELHERCQILEQISVASLVHEDGQTPMSKRAPTADGKCRTKITFKRKKPQVAAVSDDVSSDSAIQVRNVSRSRVTGMANNQVPCKRKAVAVQEYNDPDDNRVMPALDIVVAGPSSSPPTNLEQFGQLLGSEIANLVTGKCSSFWLQVQEQVSVASLWKGKHEGLLRANTELSSKMAEKNKDCLVKEAEWKKTVAALRDELASVRVADGLAIEGFQMQKQVLEGELKRLKNSSTPVVEGLKEKAEATKAFESTISGLQDELEAKKNALTEAQREIVSLNTCSQPVVITLKDKLSSVEAELSCKTLAGMKYKKALDSKIVIISELEFKIEGLDDEINKLKFALERADASSKIARVELSQAKKDLRLLQLETDNDMALSGSSRY
ncbi:hypothetical protein R1sor_024618 [Riccia sorocarpa]|uniref:Uncharacterized protein n=1 Tax=Riccia sorocarpa TaxID=122646 RepID=A0ABD3GR08_9MARC